MPNRAIRILNTLLKIIFKKIFHNGKKFMMGKNGRKQHLIQSTQYDHILKYMYVCIYVYL